MYKFIILTSISSALEIVFKTQIQPEIKGVADIAMYVIAAVLLIALIAVSYTHLTLPTNSRV